SDAVLECANALCRLLAEDAIDRLHEQAAIREGNLNPLHDFAPTSDATQDSSQASPCTLLTSVGGGSVRLVGPPSQTSPVGYCGTGAFRGFTISSLPIGVQGRRRGGR